MTRQAHTSPPTAILTVREREVVSLVVAGLSNKELSQRLKVAEGTIKVHLHNIYEKLGVTGRGQLILLARERKDLFGRYTQPRYSPRS